MKEPNPLLADEAVPSTPISQLLERAMPRFTLSQKKLADLIYRDMSIFAFEPAVNIGKQVGVSEATVHRFAAQLGFLSFSDLQKYAQAAYAENRTISRLHRMKFEPGSTDHVWQTTLELDVLNLETTFQLNSEESIWEGAKLIAGAQRIYIAGWRAGLAVTASLNYTLNLMLGNSELLPMYGGLHEHLSFSGPSDVLIVMGLPRYCNVTLEAAKFAVETGVKLLVITDAPSSPFVPLGSVVYYTAAYSGGFLDSYVAPLSLTNALVSAVSHLRREDVVKNLHRMERIFGNDAVRDLDGR